MLTKGIIEYSFCVLYKGDISYGFLYALRYRKRKNSAAVYSGAFRCHVHEVIPQHAHSGIFHISAGKISLTAAEIFLLLSLCGKFVVFL